jgi:adenosylcobinamide-GDP ribazoletransferase
VSGARIHPAPPGRWRELRVPLAALAFLTLVPAGRWVSIDGEDVARAGPAFPLVGGAIGAAVGAIAASLAHPLSPLLAAGLALAAGVLLTGALHLDALADSADALGARSREQALAIMRDHAVGAYGAVAIALGLLIKAGCLIALVADGDALRFAIVAGALSRTAPVLLAAALPYARGDGGTGHSLTYGSRARASLAAVVAIAIAVAAAGVEGVIAAACALAFAVLFGLIMRRALGGVTGDLLGAAVELTELVVFVAAVALLGGRA